jgi:hypothetical protein
MWGTKAKCYMQTPITKPSKPIQISKNIPTCFEPYDRVPATGTYDKLPFIEKM